MTKKATGFTICANNDLCLLNGLQAQVESTILLSKSKIRYKFNQYITKSLILKYLLGSIFIYVYDIVNGWNTNQNSLVKNNFYIKIVS